MPQIIRGALILHNKWLIIFWMQMSGPLRNHRRRAETENDLAYIAVKPH